MPPPDAANNYVPSACPGGRPPHLWLDDGRSLYDTFGFDWTLLRVGMHPPPAEPFSEAARRLGLSLKVVDLPQAPARDLYGADLALIRPDQIVGWRGDSADAADSILRRLTGWDA